ncbi:MAG: tetratricopeptide repeat protein [Cupriavidus sp.]|nr:MAG: tetratricopeptide repeat protein [Cupriavidus sp.]
MENNNRPPMNSGNRPETGKRPDTGAGNNRPPIGSGNTKPGEENRPNTRPGNETRPNAENRPGANNRPGVDNRPGTANRPATLPGMDNRLPGTNNRLPNGAASTQDRRNDLQSRLKNNPQDDRQDFRNNNREDWQNWANNNHNDWYHGYNYGGWWNHGWDEHPGWMAFGMTSWGLNRMAWGFGLGAYSNPYYVAPATTPVYNYSQPIVQQPVANTNSTQTASTANPPGAGEAGTTSLDQARNDFYAGNYPSALDNVNAALKDAPTDAAIHEFRALILFAMGRYNEAASTIHPVLAVGPGWDWATLVGLYPAVDVYTDQLRNLETYTKSNPNAADAYFLLAYHYLTCDHKEAAHKTFQKVVQLQPKDAVAAQYAKLTATEPPAAEKTTPQPPAVADIPADKQVVDKDLIGTWKASGGNGTTFSLDLNDAGEFVWAFTQGKNTQTVKGVYAIDNNKLAMEPDSGGTMLADLTKKSMGFHFDMEGAPAGDPGLDFSK